MTTNKPVIELKNIKFYPEMSEETYCYTATLYADGRKVATVENRGTGGSDRVLPIEGGYAVIKALEERIKATYPRRESNYFPEGLEPSLEGICADLVSDFLLKKEFKSAMKRICVVLQGEEDLKELPAKFKPTPEIIGILKGHPKLKDATFLAELPEDEAFALFKKCMGV